MGQHRAGGMPRRLTIDAAMRRAIDLAASGPASGPNPQVGCVLLAPPPGGMGPPAGVDGGPPSSVPREVLAEGVHLGAGTAHAEADALAKARAAGAPLRGATAVVTLEPCRHTGRTGPCAPALAEAGIAEVIYALPDPDPKAGGGAELLRRRGLRVHAGVGARQYRALLAPWLTANTRERPFVTAKLATSLDGRVAAADGTSRWLTGATARADAHRRRAEVDAIAVGTGTLLADDPALTARLPGGDLAADQPLRVVIGCRPVPEGARVRGPGGQLLHLPTRSPQEVLERIARAGVRHLLLDGGPGLITSFICAGLVDQLHVYIAPVLLGSGRPAITGLDLTTLADAPRWHTTHTQRLDGDVLVTARAAQHIQPPTADPDNQEE